jgi:hypothetical protein
MQCRHLQIEHRQRHRNRKDAVTERLDAAEMQLTLSETTMRYMRIRSNQKSVIRAQPSAANDQ